MVAAAAAAAYDGHHLITASLLINSAEKGTVQLKHDSLIMIIM